MLGRGGDDDGDGSVFEKLRPPSPRFGLDAVDDQADPVGRGVRRGYLPLRRIPGDILLPTEEGGVEEPLLFVVLTLAPPPLKLRVDLGDEGFLLRGGFVEGHELLGLPGVGGEGKHLGFEVIHGRTEGIWGGERLAFLQSDEIRHLIPI